MTELRRYERRGAFAVITWKVRKGAFTGARWISANERRTRSWCAEQVEWINRMHRGRQHYLEHHTVERMPDWLIGVLDEEEAEQAMLYEQIRASQHRVRVARENWTDKLPEPRLPRG